MVSYCGNPFILRGDIYFKADNTQKTLFFLISLCLSVCMCARVYASKPSQEFWSPKEQEGFV